MTIAHPLPKRIAALLAAGLTVLSLIGCTAPAPTTDGSASPSAGRAPVAAAIGDSIAIGNGVPADDAWPLLVADEFGWTLSDFAESAAGFTAPGLNTHTFDDQVSAVIRLRPDIVIVAATRNDVFASTAGLQAVATDALHRLRVALPDAQIIGVGPVWGSGVAPAQIAVIDATVKKVVLGVDGMWVEVGQPFAGHPELVQTDGVHPTVAGQRLLAGLVIKQISAHLPSR
ncbi:SGNH/GDSL hydrolase family protein [Leifsonia aquatica]|uniref:SGNH/GDSL hydrolase family protein n=1 Tax=Leifsonia aquatica TaxID=144185 RepID=UPI0038153914